MKKEGNEWFYWGAGTNKWFKGKLCCNVSAERAATFEARPQEDWDGQGLPPVGAKCLTDRNDFLREVTILCHGKTRTFVFDHVSQEEICLVLKDRVFLPIRTPDQIAAEEREKAVGDMAMSIQGVPYQYPTLYALYDAGYRRQEEGK
ncbi:hypothetical protein I5K88_28975 [Pseudomonas aeruginosa]|nr:hypothetical protein [Pseudomonas aeruginosa]